VEWGDRQVSPLMKDFGLIEREGQLAFCRKRQAKGVQAARRHRWLAACGGSVGNVVVCVYERRWGGGGVSWDGEGGYNEWL